MKLTSLLFLSVALSLIPHAGASTCTVSGLTAGFPGAIAAGQTFAVESTFSLSCESLNSPLVQVQLRNDVTGQIISTVTKPYTAYYFAVVNVANATSTEGLWPVSVHVSVVGASTVGTTGFGQFIAVYPPSPIPVVVLAGNYTEPTCRHVKQCSR